MLQPHQQTSNACTNYNWVTLGDCFNEGYIIPCGSNSYIGSVIACDSYVKQFLKAPNATINVVTHYKEEQPNEQVYVNSRVDDNLYTSFTIKKGDAEVIFIPQTSLASLNGLVGAFDTASNKWRIPDIGKLETQINHIDDQVDELGSQRDGLATQVTVLNKEVAGLIVSDVYLAGAIKSYELTQGVANPEPDNFYEAVEAIENAFMSEREMRETLGFDKAYIDKIMRRTNEFRHQAKSGEEPAPLTNEEIAEFTSKTEEIISSYINYLHVSSVITEGVSISVPEIV